MKLEFINRDKLFIDKTNMRYGKKMPDVDDILPTVRKRGIIQPLIVRPADVEGRFGIVAGRRRWTADAAILAEGIDHGALPCAILEVGDDADAIEASLIENLARLDPDEVTQWDTFTRLVKEGRSAQDIAHTFGLPDLMVRRVLALGNLLPRIRGLYAAEKIDRATVRHLTLASKSRQRGWLALFDDADAYVPTGHQLKAWLLDGQSIPPASPCSMLTNMMVRSSPTCSATTAILRMPMPSGPRRMRPSRRDDPPISRLDGATW